MEAVGVLFKETERDERRCRLFLRRLDAALKGM